MLLLKIDKHVTSVIALASKYYFKLFSITKTKHSELDDYHFITFIWGYIFIKGSLLVACFLKSRDKY